LLNEEEKYRFLQKKTELFLGLFFMLRLNEAYHTRFSQKKEWELNPQYELWLSTNFKYKKISFQIYGSLICYTLKI
jgi:hypothetical protein